MPPLDNAPVGPNTIKRRLGRRRSLWRWRNSNRAPAPVRAGRAEEMRLYCESPCTASHIPVCTPPTSFI